MNIITIAGNIARDAELRYTNSGDAVAVFSVADNQVGKDKQAIFWNCSVFGKRGESLAPYLTKGSPVTVVGVVTEREWTDRDGAKRKAMDVRVSEVALQGGRRDGGQQQQQARPAPAGAPADEDIPFTKIDWRLL